MRMNGERTTQITYRPMGDASTISEMGQNTERAQIEGGTWNGENRRVTLPIKNGKIVVERGGVYRSMRSPEGNINVKSSRADLARVVNAAPKHSEVRRVLDANIHPFRRSVGLFSRKEYSQRLWPKLLSL